MKKYCFGVFSKGRSFFGKDVISRVWRKRGNRQTHPPTHALIVWEVGGGGGRRGGLFRGFG